MLLGIPQGSVLGPLLFVILITDIDRNTQSTNLGYFADNTRIWQSLNTTHSPQHIQTALDQIYIWAEYNMFFNGDKFKLLNFGKSTRTFHYETP